MADEQRPQPPDSLDAPRTLGMRLRAVGPVARRIIAGAMSLVRRHRRIIAVTGMGLFVLGSVLVTIWYVQSMREVKLRQELTIERALELFDAGDYAAARRVAKFVPRAKNLTYDELGEVHFVIGAAIAYETDEAWDEPNRANLYGLAARHLQEANARRFPAGREDEGRYLLGKCLSEVGRFSEAIGPLLAVRSDASALHADSQILLTRAYLHLSPPELEQARLRSEAFTAAAKQMPAKQDEIALLSAEVALAAGELDDCQRWLDQIPDTSQKIDEARLLRGQYLMARASNRQNKDSKEETATTAELYRQAAILFRRAQSNHASGQSLSSKASYLTGIALRQQGEDEAALDQFVRTRKRFYNTPEGVAAGIDETQILLELERFEQANAALQRVASHAVPGVRVSNPYFSEKELKEVVERFFQSFYANHRYELAVQLAPTLSPLIGATSATQRYAESLENWGRHLAKDATSGEQAPRRDLQRDSRKKYRLAGDAYAQLARQRYVTREYPLDLWRSGQNFNRGRDYGRAIIVLREYLTSEAQAERPLVLIALAEAYLALDRVDESIATIEDCLRDFSRNPAVYQARLVAGRTYVEHGDRDRARELLLSNLHHEALTPRSDAWRDSLFALGIVQYEQGRIQITRSALETPAAESEEDGELLLERGHQLLHDAIRSLSEAVARYPEAEQAIEARYAIAESYRYGSRMPLRKLARESIESRRAALNRQIEEELSAALTEYDELLQIMNEKSQSSRGLTHNEEKVMRNAYFARGTVLYDLGDYESAIKAYSTATSRYQHEPAAIEAYIQIAACYRRLNQPLQARGTLEQAKLVMDRIGPEAEFTATTRFDRDEWANLLTWLSSL